MDHKHAKGSADSEASEKKEEDPIFPVYPAAQQPHQDSPSAMALAFGHQYIGSWDDRPAHGQGSLVPASDQSGMRQPGFSQPTQDQGKRLLFDSNTKN